MHLVPMHVIFNLHFKMPVGTLYKGLLTLPTTSGMRRHKSGGRSSLLLPPQYVKIPCLWKFRLAAHSLLPVYKAIKTILSQHGFRWIQLSDSHLGCLLYVCLLAFILYLYTLVCCLDCSLEKFKRGLNNLEFIISILFVEKNGILNNWL